jgi:hypothetical protein
MTPKNDTPRKCLERAAEMACSFFLDRGKPDVADQAADAFLEEIRQSPHRDLQQVVSRPGFRNALIREFDRVPDAKSFVTFLKNLDIRD